MSTSYYVACRARRARPARATAADVAEVHRYEPPRGGVAEATHDGVLRNAISV
jgi:hypothetical protein